jgi:hypothetical protein
MAQIASPAIPEGVGRAGTTMCAPFGISCAGPKRSSEQDWQSVTHAALGAKLKRLTRERYTANSGLIGRPLNLRDDNYGMYFHFRMVNNPGNQIASSVLWQRTNNGVAGVPSIVRVPKRDNVATREIPQNMTYQELFAFGSSLTSQDLQDYGYISDSLTVGNDVHSEKILRRRFDPSATGHHWEDHEVLHEPFKRSTEECTRTQASEEPDESDDLPTLENVEVIPWNMSASDVDVALTTYDGETQQRPTSDRIDVIALSEM